MHQKCQKTTKKKGWLIFKNPKGQCEINFTLGSGGVKIYFPLNSDYLIEWIRFKETHQQPYTFNRKQPDYIKNNKRPVKNVLHLITERKHFLRLVLVYIMK